MIHSQAVRRNLRLYGWGKVFAMRVFLPVTNIYFVEVAGLTLPQIGLLGAVASITTLVATIPSGYFADRVTRKAAMTIATILMALSTTLFVVMPNLAGAIIGTILGFTGYAFYSGAGEALVHDTLVEMGEPDSYIKVMGRAQAFGLVGNIVLVGLVPLTYAIDKRLPFICGTIAAVLFLGITLRMVEPLRSATTRLHHNPVIDLYRGLRQLVGRHTVVLFFAIGLASGSYLALATFSNLIFQDLGLSPANLGLMFAAASILAAAGGWYLHHLQKLSLPAFALLDSLIAAGFYLTIGLTRNLWLAVIAFLINMSFWRYRKILYQDYMLRRFGHDGNKATLISTLGFFENVSGAALQYPLVIAVTAGGYYLGYSWVGTGLLVMFGLSFWLGFKLIRRQPLAQARS